MIKRIFLTLLLVNFFLINAQENFQEFKYYDIYEDYVANKSIEPIVNTQVKRITPEYIIVGKKINKGLTLLFILGVFLRYA